MMMMIYRSLNLWEKHIVIQNKAYLHSVYATVGDKATIVVDTERNNDDSVSLDVKKEVSWELLPMEKSLEKEITAQVIDTHQKVKWQLDATLAIIIPLCNSS